VSTGGSWGRTARGLTPPRSKERIHLSGLFGSRVLEAALGLASIYLLLAMFCSTVNEWIAALLAVRARMLKKGLGGLLGETAKEFYEHPTIQALIQDGAHPEHIAPGVFAQVVMDIATPNRRGSIGFEDLERGLTNDLRAGRLRTSLLAAIQGTEKQLDQAQRAIERWFDDAMDAVSRRYRRRAELWNAMIAAAVTAATNADTIRLSSALLAGNPAGESLGWHGAAATWNGAVWLGRLLGWMLTTAAVSLGAPFWFDAARNLLAMARTRANGRDN
jgi:hypothetical protein